MRDKTKIFLLLNGIEILGVFFVLFLALLFQVKLGELPCPLCLLQRIGFLGIIIGLLLNIRFGFRPVHYSLVLLSALFLSFVALRQIALHVVPGTGFYGDAVLGWHLYTWSFVFAMCVLIYTAVILSFDLQYQLKYYHSKAWKIMTHVCFFLVFSVLIANVISTYLECGFAQCAENPIHYKH